MVRLRFLALCLALPLAVGVLSGCDDDTSPVTMDMGVPDLNIFVGCDPAKGTQTNPACPSNLPQCHPAAGICVGCIPSSQTCTDGYICSQDNYKCEPIDLTKPCTRNVDCPRRVDGANPMAIICDVNDGLCYECVNDIDCVNPISGGLGYCNPAGRHCTAPPDGGT